jgi:hypothetical protein
LHLVVSVTYPHLGHWQGTPGYSRISLLPSISAVGNTVRTELRRPEDIEEFAPTDLRVRSREYEMGFASPKHILPCLPAVIKLLNSRRHLVQKKVGLRTPFSGCFNFKWSRICFSRSSPVHCSLPLFPLHD